MTEAIGLTRLNDTPIGGGTEFRGNMQGGEVYGVDSVPVWDGTKFSPGTNSALLLGYGGLAVALSAGHTADGSIIDNWDAVTPLFGVPLQTIPSAPTGNILISQAGVYDVGFELNAANLTNNVSYVYTLVINGVSTNFGCAIAGSNNVSEQSSGFALMAQIGAGVNVAVDATAPASQSFDIVNASFTVKRIG